MGPPRWNPSRWHSLSLQNLVSSHVWTKHSNAIPMTSSEIKNQLNGSGLYLRTGPFTVRIQSKIPSVAHNLASLYRDHSMSRHEDFADFHLRLEQPAGLRRWIQPQVVFSLDGMRPFKPLPLNQAFPMFEWGLNWCISNFAHSYLVVHAAVVAREGLAAVLPAPPGSGKSTLCAALVHRGWRLLSDELALIDIEDGTVVPIPRPISLKGASIELMNAYVQNAVFSNAVHDTAKGTIAHLKPPLDSVQQASEKARVGWIIFPQYTASAAPQLGALQSSRAMLQLAANSFNFRSLGGRGFELLADVIQNAACYEFTYSRLDDAVDVFSSLRAEVTCL